MGFLKGTPTKAFIYQDHDAHIAAHQSFMQDPMIAQTVGQNPMAQQMSAAMQAHIAEHLAFLYRKKIEEQMGIPLPPPEAKLPEDIEVNLSRLVAQASTQLMQKNMAQAQQQQAQQQMQDPIMQMQQAELKIKAQDSQTKAQKVQGDLAIKQQELQLKAQELSAKQGEDPRITALKAQMDMQQAAQSHAQQLAHTDQAHQQKLTHAQQQMMLKAQQMQTNKPTTPKE
jgi:hypothetical protein